MDDVAILLNLTDRLVIEATDPLLGILNVGKPLLYYDRLSVEKYPTDPESCCEHIERLASSMRNLLEARARSAEDNNERIRLIITLDLAEKESGSKEGTQKCFPAQRVRQIKNIVRDAFGGGNPLLKRFDYAFIFIADGSEEDSQDAFYQTLAYDGYSGGLSEAWIVRDSIQLNGFRNAIIQKLNSPDEELLLTENSIRPFYGDFESKLSDVLRAVADRMGEAGLKKEFMTLFEEKASRVKTVGGFSQFDYESTILECVSQLIGLSSPEFREDCTFFIICTSNNTAQQLHNSETFVASLVQLLATLGRDQYDQQLKSKVATAPARVFMRTIPDSSDIDEGSLAVFERQVRSCIPVLETARWNETKKVKYLVYSPKTQDPETADSHRELNDKLSEQRKEKFDRFVSDRKVPFFFGKRIGDWSWYKTVLKSVEDLFHFESINDRPLYDPPKRIADREMAETVKESTYAELEDNLHIQLKNMPEIPKGKGLNAYLRGRYELMAQFGEAIEKLKGEMVKLGFLACIFWIGVFSMLGFTLNYAYHFFWFDNTDNPWLIAACFGAASLLFVVSAIVGRACVRSKIKAVYAEIDGYYRKLQDNLKQYLADVNERVRLQNEADVRRRNLEEMQSKMDEFQRHNRQVDIWKSHFNGIATKLSEKYRHSDELNGVEKIVDIRENDFDMAKAVPSLPDAIRDQFIGTMSTLFTNQVTIDEVTSFVSRFKFAEEAGI